MIVDRRLPLRIPAQDEQGEALVVRRDQIARVALPGFEQSVPSPFPAAEVQAAEQRRDRILPPRPPSQLVLLRGPFVRGFAAPLLLTAYDGGQGVDELPQRDGAVVDDGAIMIRRRLLMR